MHLLTEWEGRIGKYLAQGLYTMAESQIFSHLLRPNSVNKYFITPTFLCLILFKNAKKKLVNTVFLNKFLNASACKMNR